MKTVKYSWGKPLWISIHNIALSFPENPTPHDRMVYKEFYIGLGNVIPCKICAGNYKEHLKEIPIDQFLYNRIDLFRWTVDIHNIVNKQNGKKIWSVEEALDYYMNARYAYEGAIPANTIGCYKNILLLVIILLVISNILVLLWRYNN